MKLFRSIIAGMLSAVMLCGCSGVKDNPSSQDVVVPEFSDKYLVGTTFGGSGWGEFYDCLSAKVTVCTNKEIIVELPQTENHSVTGYEQAATLTLTDEQYNVIEKALDREKLYTLDPELDREACDGTSYVLTLYGTDDQPLKGCGGYMPQNKEFMYMYRTVQDNLPVEELSRMRLDWIEQLRKKAE